MNRRDFIVLGATTVGATIAHHSAPTAQALTNQIYNGIDMSDWEVALGDALFSSNNQLPVAPTDIQSLSMGTHTELQCNRFNQGIMAHNITYKRLIDEQALAYRHLAGYQFRLPYLPSTSNGDLNAQTVEGGLFIWDGAQTRLDYGLAFQWVLNPWMSSFGDVWCWSSTNGGQWVPSGYLKPDTEWHQLDLVFDYQTQATSLKLDGQTFLTSFTFTPKPDSWGTETAARLQAEIISIWPGWEASYAPMHKAEFKNWYWQWKPNTGDVS